MGCSLYAGGAYTRVNTVIAMSELDGFLENLSAKLDSTSTHLIKQILEVHGFTTCLSIKLISEKHLELNRHVPRSGSNNGREKSAQLPHPSPP